MKTFGWSKEDPETFEPLELERDVKFGKPLHLGDVFDLVDAFDATGHYRKGRQGKPPLTEGSLFKAIKDFQTDEGLDADAWMTPGGPTLQRLNEVLPQKLGKPWRGAQVKAPPLYEPAAEPPAPVAEPRALPADIGDWTFADLARHRRFQGLPPGIGPAYRFSEDLARTPQPARASDLHAASHLPGRVRPGADPLGKAVPLLARSAPAPLAPNASPLRSDKQDSSASKIAPSLSRDALEALRQFQWTPPPLPPLPIPGPRPVRPVPGFEPAPRPPLVPPMQPPDARGPQSPPLVPPVLPAQQVPPQRIQRFRPARGPIPGVPDEELHEWREIVLTDEELRNLNILEYNPYGRPGAPTVQDHLGWMHDGIVTQCQPEPGREAVRIESGGRGPERFMRPRDPDTGAILENQRRGGSYPDLVIASHNGERRVRVNTVTPTTSGDRMTADENRRYFNLYRNSRTGDIVIAIAKPHPGEQYDPRVITHLLCPVVREMERKLDLDDPRAREAAETRIGEIVRDFTRAGGQPPLGIRVR